jgi:hypothetical protein
VGWLTIWVKKLSFRRLFQFISLVLKPPASMMSAEETSLSTLCKSFKGSKSPLGGHKKHQ